MRRTTAAAATLAALALLSAPPARAVDIADTRLLSEPAASATHLAFAYANDLWVAGPRRLRRCGG